MSTTTRGVARRRAWLAALIGGVLGCGLLASLLLGLDSGSSGPPTGAARMVPADALAYVHVSTERRRPEVGRALALLARFPLEPGFVTGLDTQLAVAGRWLGREAAVALLAQGTLTVLDVTDQQPARARLLAAGAQVIGSYRDESVLRLPSGAEVIFVGHYAAIGSDPAIRATIDVASGGAALAGDAAYRRAADGEPADRVLDAYVSAAGVRRLLQAHHGLLAGLGSLVAAPTLLGATLSVSPAPAGFRLHLHRALDAGIVGVNDAPARAFTPSLQTVIPAGTTLMLDESRLDRAAPGLLSAAAAAGVGTTIAPLLSRLGAALSAEGVDVRGAVSIFHGETAVAVTAAQGARPALLIVTRVADEDRARATLAALEPPLAQLFSSSSSGAGQTPLINDFPTGDADIHELALGPGLRIDYTVAHGLAIIATSRGAVRAVLRRASGLNSERAYRSVVPAHPPKMTSLLFLDFNQLLNLVEQTGLIRGVGYSALRPDLTTIRTVSLRTTSGEADSTAELLLQIS